MEKKAGSFSGSLGFVLAAAGSAVGVGNIWRFPYLAAQDGGGLFILVYLVLVLTFGFTLLTTGHCYWTKNKKECVVCFWCDFSKVEFSRKTDISCSGSDHDILFCDWRMGYQICGDISERKEQCSS